MESLYKSSFCIQLVAKTKPKRDISLWACTFIGYSFSISFFLMITRLFSLLFQMLKSLTDTCFNMHIFSNQSNNTSSLTVLYCYNRMYRRLTNPILFCRLTHRCIVVYDISCNFHCPFLDITFHENSPHSLLFYNLCGEILMYVCIILANDYLPQHFLYFLPEPQGQGSFLPIFGSVPTYGVCISSPFI